MIDLKSLRDDPDRYRTGAALKRVAVDIDRVLELDAARRSLLAEQQELQAKANKAAKEMGPQIGKLSGQLKKAEGDEKAAIEAQLAELKAEPQRLKERVQQLDTSIAEIAPELDALLLEIPQPPDPDVPRGESEADNVELRTWSPDGYDLAKPFADNRGFAPLSHVDLVEKHGLADFVRGVKLGGTRHYVLTGLGARLHHAVLRLAHDMMVEEHGYTPVTVPVIVREEMMVGTGFFPAGRDQAYHIEETRRGSGHDLFLTGTGEVSLMGLHEGEILDEADLPLTYVTVSTCFRREAGAAGRDSAGLYRIHQFDKVEQVVICKADEAESRDWHQKMLSFVESLLQRLELPYRLLQCCTADLGVKNADMIDVECWMPSRGEDGPDGKPTGAFGETHSASRLYDYQCRRLNMRYRAGGEAGKGPTTFCHSLNNTVAASPRILIPLLEMHQTDDGGVRIPEALRRYMGGVDRIG